MLSFAPMASATGSLFSTFGRQAVKQSNASWKTRFPDFDTSMSWANRPHHLRRSLFLNKQKWHNSEMKLAFWMDWNCARVWNQKSSPGWDEPSIPCQEFANIRRQIRGFWQFISLMSSSRQEQVNVQQFVHHRFRVTKLGADDFFQFLSRHGLNRYFCPHFFHNIQTSIVLFVQRGTTSQQSAKMCCWKYGLAKWQTPCVSHTASCHKENWRSRFLRIKFTLTSAAHSPLCGKQSESRWSPNGVSVARKRQSVGLKQRHENRHHIHWRVIQIFQ